MLDGVGVGVGVGLGVGEEFYSAGHLTSPDVVWQAAAKVACGKC